jgi:hypothetical protein
MSELHADPTMLALFHGGEHAAGGLVTGIYVRARVGEGWEAVDVACLTRKSFAHWIDGLEADGLRRTLLLVVGLLRAVVETDHAATVGTDGQPGRPCAMTDHVPRNCAFRCKDARLVRACVDALDQTARVLEGRRNLNIPSTRARAFEAAKAFLRVAKEEDTAGALPDLVNALEAWVAAEGGGST